MTIDVPGNQQPVHQEVVFANMTADPKSPAAPGGKIDPTLLKTFSLIDITAAFGTVFFGLFPKSATTASPSSTPRSSSF
jgi:hypothetical protein